MMEVDISGIWGELSLPDLLGLERAVFDAHRYVAAAPEDYGLTKAQLAADFNLYSFENPAWLYTAARKLLFRLGRTREQVIFYGPDAEKLKSFCELLPGELSSGSGFVTLVCAGLPEADMAEQAEKLAAEGQPVILLNPETPEQLGCFFRFSAALWEKLP